MTDQSHLPKHGVHLVPQRADVERLRAVAADAGRVVVRIDMGDVRDQHQLFAAVARELAIPHPISGFDALAGLLAGLDERTECACGYLLTLEGLDGLREHARDDFTSLLGILPSVCDRWHTTGTGFSVVLHATLPALAHARAVLDEANAARARAGLGVTVVTGPHVTVHPRRTTSRAEPTLVEDLLVSGLDDWVYASEVYGIAARSGVTDPHARRGLAVGLIAEVLVPGLMVAGDLAGGSFLPWELSTGDALARIADDWFTRADPEVEMGEVAWLDNTPAGDAIGRAVLDRQ